MCYLFRLQFYTVELSQEQPISCMPAYFYLGVRVEKQGLHGVGDFAAALAHVRSKKKRGMGSKVAFHLVPLLVSVQSTYLREAFPLLHCYPSL